MGSLKLLERGSGVQGRDSAGLVAVAAYAVATRSPLVRRMSVRPC